MTQRMCAGKKCPAKPREKAPDPLTETGEKFRFFTFLRCGFTAPDDSAKTTFSTYTVLVNAGVDEEALFSFLKKELGFLHFPSLLAEFDGHIALMIFKAAELEGLLVLEKRVSGARIQPLEERFRGNNPE
jgi:hypothetical protein